MIEFFNKIGDILNKIIDGLISIFGLVPKAVTFVNNSISIIPGDFVNVLLILLSIAVVVFIARFFL